jgi:hypothetical protein
MKSKKRVTTIALAAICAVGGAAAGISSSSAAKSSTSTNHAARTAGAGQMGRGPGGGPGEHGGPSVHEVEVVLDKAGTAYIDRTTDSGTITAIDSSAGTITLKEGTSSVTYATPTITIPADATVTLDGSSSSLEKLAVGEEVSISSSSEGTTVFATDSSFHPSGRPDAMDGPPPPGAPYGG